MRRANLVAGVLVLVVASFFIWGAARTSLGSIAAPGSGFVPFWEGVLLALAGLVVVATSLRQASREAVEWPKGEARRMTLHLTAALAGYLLLVPLLGYTLSTFLFMVAATSAWKRYSWGVTALSAAGFSALLFVLFNVLLDTPLPRNSLGLP